MVVECTYLSTTERIGSGIEQERCQETVGVPIRSLFSWPSLFNFSFIFIGQYYYLSVAGDLWDIGIRISEGIIESTRWRLQKLLLLLHIAMDKKMSDAFNELIL